MIILSVNPAVFAMTDSNNKDTRSELEESIYKDLFSNTSEGNETKQILDDSVAFKFSGNIIIDTIPNGLKPMEISYNKEGLNDNVKDVEGNNISYEYNEDGKVSKYIIKNANGTIQLIGEYTYTLTSRIETIKVKNSDGILIEDYLYLYDDFDNLILKKDITSGKYIEYKYDKTKKFSDERYYQLKDEIYYNSENTIILSKSYRYDKEGNRLRENIKEDKNLINTDYEYNEKNQLIKSSKSIYVYDEKGNIIEDKGLKNKFNTESQLIKSEIGNSIISYNYNKKGLVVGKTVNDKEINYHYSAGDITWITDKNDNLKYYFTRDANNRLLNFIDYTSESPRTYWYILDDHQNIIGLVDDNGNKVVSYDYDAWGNILKETGNTLTGDGKLLRKVNPFRYSSYLYDNETGYYYLKARYYDPTIGRFISEDSFEDHKDNSIHQNLYLYCINNPVNFYDPSGHILLSVGSWGNDVINIQVKLEILGYLDKSPDSPYGYYGSKTEEAVRAYQQDNQLVVDGIVGSNTWNSLIEQGQFYLAWGSNGPMVTKLQQELNRLGYYTGAIDGDFGPQTLDAVNAFKDYYTPGGNTGVYRGKIGVYTWYDQLFPLGEVSLSVPSSTYIDNSVTISVSSKNAHHVGIEIIYPDGTQEWFVNTEGENYSVSFIPTMRGKYQIVGASRNTATEYDLNTKRLESEVNILDVDFTWNQKVINGKTNLESLGYDVPRENNGEFDATWNLNSKFNIAIWDFLADYGLENEYIDNGYNSNLLFARIEQAAENKIHPYSYSDDSVEVYYLLEELFGHSWSDYYESYNYDYLDERHKVIMPDPTTRANHIALILNQKKSLQGLATLLLNSKIVQSDKEVFNDIFQSLKDDRPLTGNEILNIKQKLMTNNARVDADFTEWDRINLIKDLKPLVYAGGIAVAAYYFYPIVLELSSIAKSTSSLLIYQANRIATSFNTSTLFQNSRFLPAFDMGSGSIVVQGQAEAAIIAEELIVICDVAIAEVSNVIAANMNNVLFAIESYNNGGGNLSNGMGSYNYDLSKLVSTDNFRDGSIKHIFEGDLKDGKVSGYHYESVPDTQANVIPGTETTPNEFGVYKAKVEINGIVKTANNGYSTFFPKHWKPQEVVDAINEAYSVKTFISGNIYMGISSSGVSITMYLDTSGKIISAFPVY